MQNGQPTAAESASLIAPSIDPVVTLVEVPQDLRLYPRDAQGFGHIVVAGEWQPVAGVQLQLEVSSADGWTALARTDAQARQPGPFSLSIAAPAGLVDYDVLLSLHRAEEDEIVGSWSGIAVGDALLIHGQSNAVAADYYDQNLSNARDQSRWIRSYGTTSQAPIQVAADQDWHLADGEAQDDSGAVGVWALHLARRIVDEEGIPVALMLGAVGGTTVAQHQRNEANPEDLDTIYGRILWRSRQAGLAAHYRALFWYQGESDGANASGWRSGFRELQRDWSEDYASLEHQWLIQVRRGCGSPSLELRDIQRTLPQSDARFHAATANGLPQHDGCHFHDQGYLRLAEDLAPQVAHYLYGHPQVADSEAPDVQSASWASPLHDAFYLDFHNVSGTLSVPYNSWNTLTVDDGTHVQSVSAVGNRLLVQLAGASQASSVSFQGHANNSPEWMRNARGLALLSFFELPIQ